MSEGLTPGTRFIAARAASTLIVITSSSGPGTLFARMLRFLPMASPPAPPPPPDLLGLEAESRHVGPVRDDAGHEKPRFPPCQLEGLRKRLCLRGLTAPLPCAWRGGGASTSPAPSSRPRARHDPGQRI